MAILKFSACAVAAQIAHARACKTFLPNWNGPVDRSALILIRSEEHTSELQSR